MAYYIKDNGGPKHTMLIRDWVRFATSFKQKHPLGPNHAERLEAFLEAYGYGEGCERGGDDKMTVEFIVEEVTERGVFAEPYMPPVRWKTENTQAIAMDSVILMFTACDDLLNEIAVEKQKRFLGTLRTFKNSILSKYRARLRSKKKGVIIEEPPVKRRVKKPVEILEISDSDVSSSVDSDVCSSVGSVCGQDDNDCNALQELVFEEAATAASVATESEEHQQCKGCIEWKRKWEWLQSHIRLSIESHEHALNAPV